MQEEVIGQLGMQVQFHVNTSTEIAPHQLHKQPPWCNQEMS